MRNPLHSLIFSLSLPLLFLCSAQAGSSLKELHQTDTVNWVDWSSDLPEKSRESGKPIFFFAAHFGNSLARAMYHETFLNKTIAQTLNETALPVLVDVNEEPELAAFLQNLAALHFGAEEWPVCLWTTSKLQPLNGGGYFPPTDDWGGQGFLSLARNVSEQWLARPDEQSALAKEKLAMAQGTAEPKISSEVRDALFPPQPFPKDEAPSLNATAVYAYGLALDSLAQEEKTSQQSALLSFLERVSSGAGFDPVEGGFFIGSNDPSWRLPLFQKATIDQALILSALAKSGSKKQKPMATLTLSFIQNKLLKPNGLAREYLDGYSEGEMAEAIEGSHYFIEDALISQLSPEAQAAWGLKPGGNLGEDIDILGLYEGINIAYGATPDALSESLNSERERIRQHRTQLPPLKADQTAYTATNALLASSALRLGLAFEDDALKQFGIQLFETVLSENYDQEQAKLYNSDARDTPASSLAYAFLIATALDLADSSTNSSKYLDTAQELLKLWSSDPRFQSENPLLLADAPYPYLMSSYRDTHCPSAASVHLDNLKRLAEETGDGAFLRLHEIALKSTPALLAKRPQSFRSLIAILLK